MLLNAISSSPAVEDSAIGNPVTFLTDLAKPLKSLVANFLPVQASGTPSPENILPITGWDRVKVFIPTGVNRWDEQWEAGAYNSIGNPVTGNNQIRSKNLIPVEPETEYCFYINSNVNCRIYFCSENGSVISYSAYNKATFTTPAECKWLKFHTGSGYGETYTSKISINFPATETGYEPFETVYPVSFPSTVYGGYVDMVTGEVWATYQEWHGKWSEMGNTTDLTTVTRRSKLLDAKFANITTATGKQCNIADFIYDYSRDSVHYYTSASGEKTYFILFLPIGTDENTEVQICGELASPVLITTLTPQQINAIKGNNTIWSDGNGDCEVTFLKKG